MAVNRAWRLFGVENGRVHENPSAYDDGYADLNYLRVCEAATGMRSEGAAQAAAGIRAVISGEKTSFILEYPSHSPTERRWYKLRVTPFADDAQSRIVVSHENITEQKKAEHDKAKLLAQAIERSASDPLTGLINHRAFHERLDAEFARASRDGSTPAVVMLDVDNFKFFNDVYNHQAGDDVLRLVADKIRDGSRTYDSIARLGDDEFAMLIPDVGPATVSTIESRVRADLDEILYTPDDSTTSIPITISVGAALFSRELADRHECLRQADERMQWFKTGGNGEAHAQGVRSFITDQVEGFSMLDALVVAVDNKDRYTRRHSEDVMGYSLMIADEVNLDEATKNTVSIAALIHDVGKIGVPDSILRKPGALTEDELNTIKQHPEMGLIMVSTIPGLENTHDIVRHHHERWDGQGYPSGLSGEEIPMLARLVAVADAFSAMTADRPYRKGMSRRDAMDILQEGSGTQWDSRFVKAFQDAVLKHGFPSLA